MQLDRFSWLGFSIVCFLGGCSSDPDSAGSEPRKQSGKPVKTNVDGHVQKGPFITGTKITVSELDAELVQTGRAFNTTMEDDTGAFEVRGVSLSTSYARIEADGFYFDEVRGKVSDSRITMFSYADLSDRSTVNVNLLGHLEASRIENLLVKDGKSFAEAKKQAHEEVLAIFEIDPSDVPAAETLDIAKSGDGNAALLAISIMLQGTRSAGELSELLANIQSDLRKDGTLDRPELGAALVEGATTVNAESVREALKDRYAELGVAADVPEFESNVAHFATTAPFTASGGIKYPSDKDRLNVLALDTTNYPMPSGRDAMLGFVAEVPDSTELKVRLSSNLESGIWGYVASPSHWRVSTFDNEQRVQEFTAVTTGKIDLGGFQFMGSGTGKLEYFEYGSSTPTRTKEITWSGWPGAGSPTVGGSVPKGGSGGSSGGAGGAGGGVPGGAGVPGGGSAGNGSAGGEGCGNGVVDSGEQCDPMNEEQQESSCSAIGAGTAQTPILCTPECKWDTSHCTCGNGIKESFEDCDTALNLSLTCQEHMGKPGSDPWAGNVSCQDDCHFDLSACMPIPQHP